MSAPTVAPAPIQLLGYDVLDQSLQAVPEADYDAAPASVGMEMGFDVAARDDGALRLTLGLYINSRTDEETANDHHRGQFVVQGVFLWVAEDGPVTAERRRLLVVNGFSTLFGIARVHVRQLSQALPGAPLLLPMVSFRDLADDLLADADAPHT